MIIDVTRELNEDEYQNYLSLINRYCEKMFRLENNDFTRQYDDDGYFIEDCLLYTLEELTNMTTLEEDELMVDFSSRVNECLDNIGKQEGYRIINNFHNFSIVTWLEKNNADYYVIYDPIEHNNFHLAIKGEAMYKLFQIKWRRKRDDVFMQKIGWVVYQSLSAIDKEITEWCINELDDNDFIIVDGHQFYFTKEAFILFKLRWIND